MNAVVEETAEQAEAKTKTKTAVETVTMLDGRSVDFVGKRKMLKESTIDETSVVVRLDFRNGHTINFRVPDELVLKFAAHGAEQKLGDETAGEEDVDDMVLDVEALVERLNKGEWSIKREGGGMSGTSVLLRALVEFSGKSVEQMKAWLKDKSGVEKTALRNSPKIRPIVERLEAEKQAKSAKVDTDALFATLG